MGGATAGGGRGLEEGAVVMERGDDRGLMIGGERHNTHSVVRFPVVAAVALVCLKLVTPEYLGVWRF